MDWKQAHRAHLIAGSGQSALLGGRIDWVERPQGKPLPALTMQCIAEGREQHLKGFQGLQPARVQYDAWAGSQAEAQAVVDWLLGSNEAPGPAIGAYTADGHIFSRAMVELEPRDLPARVSADDGQNKSIFRISMDLIHHHAASEEGS